MKEDNKFEEIVRIASRDTEKASRIISKSFYKVLRRNGFSDEQIISVASDILGCLIESLDGYREKKSSKEESLV
jgi:glycosylphosphatidylinositol transamidase (GPIT) subunit GPI8